MKLPLQGTTTKICMQLQTTTHLSCMHAYMLCCHALIHFLLQTSKTIISSASSKLNMKYLTDQNIQNTWNSVQQTVSSYITKAQLWYYHKLNVTLKRIIMQNGAEQLSDKIKHACACRHCHLFKVMHDLQLWCMH